MQRKRKINRKIYKTKRHHKRHTRKKLKGGGLSKGKIAAAVLAGVAAAAGTGYVGYKTHKLTQELKHKIDNENLSQLYLQKHFRRGKRGVSKEDVLLAAAIGIKEKELKKARKNKPRTRKRHRGSSKQN